MRIQGQLDSAASPRQANSLMFLRQARLLCACSGSSVLAEVYMPAREARVGRKRVARVGQLGAFTDIFNVGASLHDPVTCYKITRAGEQVPKQRQVQVDWHELHCFGSSTVELAHQRV